MFIPCISSGQEGYKINGGVFDLETNSPVPYASIINLDDASGTTSEIIGQSITEIFGKISICRKAFKTALACHSYGFTC